MHTISHLCNYPYENQLTMQLNLYFIQICKYFKTSDFYTLQQFHGGNFSCESGNRALFHVKIYMKILFCLLDLLGNVFAR